MLVNKFVHEKFIKNGVVNDVHKPRHQQVKYFEESNNGCSEAQRKHSAVRGCKENNNLLQPFSHKRCSAYTYSSSKAQTSCASTSVTLSKHPISDTYARDSWPQLTLHKSKLKCCSNSVCFTSRI